MRSLFIIVFCMFLAACATTHTVATNSDDKASALKHRQNTVQTAVRNVLGREATISDWSIVRNGGEEVFQINNLNLGKEYSFWFSADHLLSDATSASKELRQMYDLLRRFPGIETVSLWNANGKNQIIRHIIIAGTHVSVNMDSTWSRAVSDALIVILEDQCPDFYMPTKGLSLNELLQIIPMFASAKFVTRPLFGVDMDLFTMKGANWLILKGNSSTILYNERTGEFRLGGSWGDSEIAEYHLDKRHLVIKEGGSRWDVLFIDTKQSGSCSAYRASQIN